ncbi:MAG: hypothetical protein ACLQVX_03285 [Limisphaerales bacterium]
MPTPAASAASCEQEWTNATALCNSQKTANDDRGSNTYYTAFVAATNTYTRTLTGDITTATEATNACTATLYGLIGNPSIQGSYGSCGAQWFDSCSTAAATYADNLAICASGNQTDYTWCVCEALAGYNDDVGGASNTLGACIVGARAQNTQCQLQAYLNKRDYDGNALATFYTAAYGALAIYNGTLTWDGYALKICDNVADSACNECNSELDCYAFPEDCCVDDCDLTLDEQMQAAYATYMTGLGQADQTEQTTIGNDLQVRLTADQSVYTAGQNLDDLYSLTYITQDNANWITMNSAIGAATVAYNVEAADCACSYGDDTPEYEDCIAEPADTYNAAVASAQSTYDTEHSALEFTYNDQVESVYESVQLIYTRDANTQTSNDAAAKETASGKSAGYLTAYNAACNSIDSQYDDCLLGCSY